MKNVWVVIVKCFIGCGIIAGLTRCTTGGGKVCFGYEEVNSIKNQSGYEIPKKDK